MAKREDRTGQGLHRFYPVKPPNRFVDPKSPRKQKTRHSLNPPVELPVGWVMGSAEETRSRTASVSSGYGFLQHWSAADISAYQGGGGTLSECMVRFASACSPLGIPRGGRNLLA